MRDELVSSRTAVCLLGGFLAVFVTAIGGAFAFPFIDANNQDSAPTGAPPGAPLGTELPATDVKGLRKQLRLTNPAGAGNPSAWTITPRLTIQEQITDNALEVTSPRRIDAITMIAPGISIGANTARLQLKFDYQPNLLLHAVNGSLNVMTQQLNMTGIVTVVPDLAFIDVRGVSGVQSRQGALAGAGTLGNAGAALAPAGTVGGGTGQGLNRQNAVQTTSFGVSPYLLKKFGDYGSAKLGVSGDISRNSQITGFAASPFPTGGGTGYQSLVTTEQIASFTTGEFLGKIQNTLSFNSSQSSTRTSTTAGATATSNSFTSQRMAINNQVSYALNRTFTLIGSVGQQTIRYSQGVAPAISGLTWNVGVTVTPGPESTLTVTYGHQNGSDSLGANAHLALTGRTSLSFDYSNTIGTQLENLQNQLNNTVIGANGQAINAQTGGQQFGGTNAAVLIMANGRVGVEGVAEIDCQNGLFRKAVVAV